MNKRSPEGVTGEWRQQGFSVQSPRRTSTGAVLRAEAAFFDGAWRFNIGAAREWIMYV